MNGASARPPPPSTPRRSDARDQSDHLLRGKEIVADSPSSLAPAPSKPRHKKASIVPIKRYNIEQQQQQQQPSSSTIRFKTHLYNTIYDVLVFRGWKETQAELDWDLYWCDVQWMREVYKNLRLEDHQRVCHFLNHYELTRKDFLVKNMKRARKALEKENNKAEAEKYDIVPCSFNMPSEYPLFVEEFKRCPAGSTWIMKPVGKAQGRGIFLFNKLSQVMEWKKATAATTAAAAAASGYGSTSTNNNNNNNEQAASAGAGSGASASMEQYIVQRYIENPYLIGGKKFDLRLYVLVTSYSPLTAYLYRNGFGRFSQHRFSMSADEIENNYIHLTNVAIQKHSDQYDSRVGAKWDLRRMKLYMCSKHGQDRVDQLFADIQSLILRSLLAVQRIMITDKHCFELYGYDILIDANFKPWLLEVNASPSLTAETQYDYDLKFGLLTDVMNILDLENNNKRSASGAGAGQERIGGFDLIASQGNLKIDPKVSYLGSFNDSLSCLRKFQVAPPIPPHLLTHDATTTTTAAAEAARPRASSFGGNSNYNNNNNTNNNPNSRSRSSSRSNAGGGGGGCGGDGSSSSSTSTTTTTSTTSTRAVSSKQ